MKKRILWSIAVVVLLCVASSGWILNTVQNRENAREKELATLMSAFNQQYGTDGITIKQVISPDKVYVAVWTDKDSVTHVSWNMAGIWVTVYNAPVDSIATPSTASP